MNLLLALSLVIAQMPDSLSATIPDVVVTAKYQSALETSPISYTQVNLRRLESDHIESIKEFSSLAPNFYQPDYGSRMTSSIYVRGFGSRIDQPIVGLYVDEAPVMNKNLYDFDFYDIRSVEILRGPQGTLYGRNTAGGVINIRTLSPLDWNGTRFSAEMASAGNHSFRLSHYGALGEDSGFSVAAHFGHSNGYFRNEHLDQPVDWSDRFALRAGYERIAPNGWHTRLNLSAGSTRQGGWAYGPIDVESGEVGLVAYDLPSSYRRTSFGGTLNLSREERGLLFSSITGYGYLSDRMDIDNDFSVESIFGLMQSQREHSLTQEFVVRTTDPLTSWKRVSGLFFFGNHRTLSAPVEMYRTGIERLILDNANRGLQTVFPEERIEIENQQLTIESDFRIPSLGAALYHQSTLSLDERWRATLGARLDYEYSAMDYRSAIGLDYRFTMTMPGYRYLEAILDDIRRLSFVVFLPKVALQYALPQGGVIYGSVAAGYKSGGFNTQIFSDIMRNHMMNTMMSDLGIYLDGAMSYDSATATTYRPERSINYELGLHLSPAAGFSVDASLFAIDCRNQQLTIFSDGNTMGRMMSNAGRSRSLGGELSVRFVRGGWNLSADYGYADARFVKYNDGVADYAGNRVPYSPLSTLALRAAYTFKPFRMCSVTLGGGYDRCGEIAWDETGDIIESPYGQYSTSLAVSYKDVKVELWGKNITDTEFNTFYFRSLGSSFVSRGLPARWGVKLSVKL